MGFVINNLDIPDDSPAARVIEQIMAEDHVSADEAVRRALQRIGGTPGQLKRKGPSVPAHPERSGEMIGAYGKWPELVDGIEEVIAGRDHRYSDRT